MLLGSYVLRASLCPESIRRQAGSAYGQAFSDTAAPADLIGIQVGKIYQVSAAQTVAATVLWNVECKWQAASCLAKRCL